MTSTMTMSFTAAVSESSRTTVGLDPGPDPARGPGAARDPGAAPVAAPSPDPAAATAPAAETRTARVAAKRIAPEAAARIRTDPGADPKIGLVADPKTDPEADPRIALEAVLPETKKQPTNGNDPVQGRIPERPKTTEMTNQKGSAVDLARRRKRRRDRIPGRRGPGPESGPGKGPKSAPGPEKGPGPGLGPGPGIRRRIEGRRPPRQRGTTTKMHKYVP